VLRFQIIELAYISGFRNPGFDKKNILCSYNYNKNTALAEDYTRHCHSAVWVFAVLYFVKHIRSWIGLASQNAILSAPIWTMGGWLKNGFCQYAALRLVPRMIAMSVGFPHSLE